ncbi:MAG: ATP synthase subunit B [Rhodospirillaceae bacterium BRH_c57]|nr:MAG: ATP synthase subunit B [Rhodospirillaceae bacterium BRH_c57]
MPQFDPASFASQLFWLAVTFVVLYFVMSRFAIPRIGEVLEQRQKMMDDDLDRAQQFKAETDEAIKTYEKALAGARAQAHDLLRQANDEISKAAEARNREIGTKLAAQIKEGEARIAQARDEALASVKDIAAAAAAATAEKLVGITPDQSAVDAAVDGAMKETAR